MTQAPVLLLIGGHDPSHGPAGFAGLRADRAGALAIVKRCQGAQDTLDVRMVSTAWTDQDDATVRSVGPRDPALWLTEARQEFARARSRGGLCALKVGLLPSQEHVETLAHFCREIRSTNPELPVVIDPILQSTSGTTFLDATAQAALLSLVLPQGVLLTPNTDEATKLTGGTRAVPDSRSLRLFQAQTLLARGARGVILTGGHGTENPLLNLVAAVGAPAFWLEHPRRPGTRRGTGCRFASALAAALGQGQTLIPAARLAANVVASYLDTGPEE